MTTSGAEREVSSSCVTVPANMLRVFQVSSKSSSSELVSSLVGNFCKNRPALFPFEHVRTKLVSNCSEDLKYELRLFARPSHRGKNQES